MRGCKSNKSLVRFGGGVFGVGSVATAVELVAVEVNSSGAADTIFVRVQLRKVFENGVRIIGIYAG